MWCIYFIVPSYVILKSANLQDGYETVKETISDPDILLC